MQSRTSKEIIMNPASKSRTGGREPPGSATEVDTKNKQTPPTDLQPEDAGTPASGNTGRGTAAEGAMKQTSKTDAESGSKR
jgi:hypothetical protein